MAPKAVSWRSVSAVPPPACEMLASGELVFFIFESMVMSQFFYFANIVFLCRQALTMKLVKEYYSRLFRFPQPFSGFECRKEVTNPL